MLNHLIDSVQQMMYGYSDCPTYDGRKKIIAKNEGRKKEMNGRKIAILLVTGMLAITGCGHTHME